MGYSAYTLYHGISGLVSAGGTTTPKTLRNMVEDAEKLDSQLVSMTRTLAEFELERITKDAEHSFQSFLFSAKHTEPWLPLLDGEQLATQFEYTRRFPILKDVNPFSTRNLFPRVEVDGIEPPPIFSVELARQFLLSMREPDVEVKAAFTSSKFFAEKLKIKKQIAEHIKQGLSAPQLMVFIERRRGFHDSALSDDLYDMLPGLEQIREEGKNSLIGVAKNVLQRQREKRRYLSTSEKLKTFASLLLRMFVPDLPIRILLPTTILSFVGVGLLIHFELLPTLSDDKPFEFVRTCAGLRC